MQILYIYFRYTGRLFLGCAVFVACCNIIIVLQVLPFGVWCSGIPFSAVHVVPFSWFYHMRNQEGKKTELQKKVQRRICVRDITFLTAHAPYYVIFCCFLCLRSFPSDVLAVWPQQKYIIFLWVVFCVIWKLWKSLAI